MRAACASLVDLGFVAPAMAFLAASSIDYDRRPWEREAYRLTTGQPTFHEPPRPARR